MASLRTFRLPRFGAEASSSTASHVGVAAKRRGHRGRLPRWCDVASRSNVGETKVAGRLGVVGDDHVEVADRHAEEGGDLGREAGADAVDGE